MDCVVDALRSSVAVCERVVVGELDGDAVPLGSADGEDDTSTVAVGDNEPDGERDNDVELEGGTEPDGVCDGDSDADG